MDDCRNIFEELVKRYGERLFWHVRGMVGSQEAASDIVQDTYLKAWKALSGFRGESDMFTWLWRIATNEAVNFLKREKIRSFLSLDAVSSDPADDPWFNGSEAQLKLERALRKLPPKQRSVFVMRYYEELPYESMSRITGTSQGALKASYHLAREKIKLYIEQDVQ